jgi:hypothetical protein
MPVMYLEVAARLPIQHRVGMMHLQEEVCPKDEKFYAMEIHLKHIKPHKKMSHYMLWRHLGGKGDIAPNHSRPWH